MIPFGKPITDKLELKLLEEVIDSGIYVHGDKTTEFENKFRKFFGYPNSISVANCTAGLHLAHFLLSQEKQLNKRNCREVICTAMTHVATAHAIELSGLKPIFVDCKYEDGNIDVNLVESKINENTIGIAAMHFNGIPCDMKAIMKLAKKYSLYVVEDCAIALGAKIDGCPVGTFGDVGAFSFHPVKQMTTGEGGMLVTNSDQFSHELKLAKAFGVDKSFSQRPLPGLYDVKRLGFNYRMAELPAALGIAQLEKYAGFSNAREKNFKFLSASLENNKKIRVIGRSDHTDRTYYCLIIEIENCNRNERNAVIEELKKADVNSSIYYPHPIPRLEYYRSKYCFDQSEFKNSTIFADHCIALPIAPHLDTNDMEYMAKTLEKIID